ncbi:Re/Si-specific NAD(P)(+) transhydrogenase subunit alpha [Dermabacter sp. p3-SID358]|uniref:Re/Si-specific NAD(P)(+) transhydrogenase subunit alpha n=1 Tax=Dermabacter sp. p3-SID358 TaxID=2916114 RepID=UPI0021A637F7|nr:Re/Si-specific NAD(P)(+) transhydrogenase subunit alpha [Dermabacter sp. p3-SID358]MCT1867626.1 Re/Si-specific NAD(P)(+) transhydrogenase subunit alpha [Dermabacter sp. p3-SID358]
MRIGIPRESLEDQPLVAATPDTVRKLLKLGYEVAVERGAGERASYLDSAYAEAGAEIMGEEVWQSDVVTTLDTPPREMREKMLAGAVLISRMTPGRNPELIDELKEQRLTALAMDAVPRISRAQSMDVLSSMANIAGYRAVIEAASNFGRLFTGQVTAAGKVPPANVYVIGAGVAGLAAIGTANSMGAIVKATDLRPEAAEQVESMGAEFVAIPAKTEKSEDGYAKEMTGDQAKAAAELYARQSAEADIVITTANIPGRKAPVLLTAADVHNMKPGSVIVDMAAANGGNCELTKPGEVYQTENGVIIVGHTDLAGRLPGQASQLYGQNIVNLMKLVTPKKDGVMMLDFEDTIVRGITVTFAHDGEADVLWPPPPVKVSAAPASPAPEATPAPAEASKAKKSHAGTVAAVIGGILGVALVLASPFQVAEQYMVLMLAIVVGYYVITSVTHSLHTPLMSETNAISGIILVGAILQVGSANIAVAILSFIAIVIASINIFGGFTVTHRMLSMFSREG